MKHEVQHPIAIRADPCFKENTFIEKTNEWRNRILFQKHWLPLILNHEPACDLAELGFIRRNSKPRLGVIEVGSEVAPHFLVLGGDEIFSAFGIDLNSAKPCSLSLILQAEGTVCSVDINVGLRVCLVPTFHEVVELRRIELHSSFGHIKTLMPCGNGSVRSKAIAFQLLGVEQC